MILKLWRRRSTRQKVIRRDRWTNLRLAVGLLRVRHVTVDLALRERGQPCILCLLFVERKLKEVDNVQAAECRFVDNCTRTELRSPGYQRAITDYLVMLDRLSGRQECRVEYLLVVDLAREFISFSE